MLIGTDPHLNQLPGTFPTFLSFRRRDQSLFSMPPYFGDNSSCSRSSYAQYLSIEMGPAHVPFSRIPKTNHGPHWGTLATAGRFGIDPFWTFSFQGSKLSLWFGGKINLKGNKCVIESLGKEQRQLPFHIKEISFDSGNSLLPGNVLWLITLGNLILLLSQPGYYTFHQVLCFSFPRSHSFNPLLASAKTIFTEAFGNSILPTTLLWILK